MFVLGLLVVVYNELGDFVEPKLHISVNTLLPYIPQNCVPGFCKIRYTNHKYCALSRRFTNKSISLKGLLRCNHLKVI